MPSFNLFTVTDGMSPEEIGGALVKSNRDALPVFSCVGDSRIAQSLQQITDANGTRTNSMPIGPFSWIGPLSQGRLNAPFTHNLAVSGSTSEESIAVCRTVNNLSPRPTHCVILTGTNDIGSGVSAEDIMTNISEMWSILNGDGVIPVTVCDLPRGVSTWSVGQSRISQDLNRRIYQQAREQGVIVINANELIANPLDSNGDPLTGYTSDGIHETTVPAYLIGKRIVDSIPIASSVERPASRVDIYDATDNPKGNGTQYGLFIGTSGTTTSSAGAVSGDVADGWNVRSLTGAGTAVCSKVSRSEAAGDFQQVVFDSPGGISTYRISLISTLTGSQVVPSVAAMFVSSMDFEVEGTSALEDCKMMCVMFDGSNFKNGSEVLKSTNVGGTFYPYDFDWSGRLVSSEIEVDDLTDQIIWRIEVRVNNGSATIRLGSGSLNGV